MLKLKAIFDISDDPMSEQIVKSIRSKFVERITQCVLSDIAENSRQDDIAGNEDDRLVE